MQSLASKYTSGPLPRQVLAIFASSWLNIISYFIVDFLTIFYLSQTRKNNEIAIIGVTSLTQYPIIGLILGISSAATVLIATCIGRREQDLVRPYASQGLLWGFLGGCLLSAFYLVAYKFFLNEIPVQDKSLSWKYTLTTTISLPISSIAIVSAGIARSIGKISLCTRLQIIAPICICLFDWAFIFIFELGVQGAAWSIMISRLIAAGYALFAIGCLEKLITFEGVRVGLRNWRNFGKACLLSVLTSLSAPVAVLVPVFFLMSYGPSVAEGITVIDRVVQISFSMYFAAPYAVMPIVAQNIGAGKFDRAGEAIKICVWIVLIHGAIASSILFLLSGHIVRDVFKSTEAAAILITFFTSKVAFAWIIIGPYFVAVGALSGIGKFDTAAAIGWWRATVGTIPFVAIGASLSGPKGVLIGQALGLGIFAIIANFILHRNFKKLRRKSTTGSHADLIAS